MSRPHRGHITGRLPKYARAIFGRPVRARLWFLVGLALLLAFPVIGWWAVVVGLGAMGTAAHVRGGGSVLPGREAISRWVMVSVRSSNRSARVDLP